MKVDSTKKKSYTNLKLKNCRICNSEKLYNFLSLGKMPIPNGFIEKKSLKQPEPLYPLTVCVCETCWFVQLRHVVPAKLMFENYLYIPSASKTMIRHFNNLYREIISKVNLKNHDLVVDIGSNDGTLLSNFIKKGVSVLGVDPAKNLAKVANKAGINTLNEFFNTTTAEKIVNKYRKAKVITASNVFAHIDNLHDMVKGVKNLLQDDGLFIIEAPYLVDLLDNNEFDTIYHEHLSYLSIRPLTLLFKKYGLKIVDIQKMPIHGGSVRVFISHSAPNYQVHPRVEKFLSEEKLKKLQSKGTYDEFARRIKVIKRDLMGFLKRIKKDGRTIIGYGASAKGNVLMNYCGISMKLVDFIVDSTAYKQGKYTPGTHIQILPESVLQKNTPDYALLMSWNFADEIIEKNKEYRERGGQFIITIPYLKII